MASPFIEIEVDNRVVKVTNPDRVYFPPEERGATKLDLVDYYLARRPRHRQRAVRAADDAAPLPDRAVGREGPPEAAPVGAPDWVETVRLHFPRWNRTADELCVTELGAVIWAVQMSTVEFHPWNSRREDPEKPDEWRIDLDPGPLSDFAQVQRVAGVTHEILDELGAVGYPKTSGGKGLHVYVRIRPDHGHKEVRRAALAFAREVERRMPDDVTTLWWRKDRDPHHLFVDYNQNARDHTIAAAYSVRGFPDARVSTPVRWDEVDDCDPHDFTIFTVPERFAALGDLHEDIDDHVFDLEPLREWADRDEAAGLTSTTGRDEPDRRGGRMNRVVDLADKLGLFSEHWSPKVVARAQRLRDQARQAQGRVRLAHPRRHRRAVPGDRGHLTIQLRDGDERSRSDPRPGSAVRRAPRRRALPDRRRRRRA